MKLWEIYLAFAKIGTVTFGGGYAMLPVIRKEIIERRDWATDQEVMDYYAVGQCLPGVITVNAALFIGNRIKGRRGGIAAALGVVTPSVVIITAISAFISNFLEYKIVQDAFYGIRIVVCALIVQTVIKLWKTAVRDAFGLTVYIIALAATLFLNIPATLLIIVSLLSGVASGIVRRPGNGGDTP